MTTKNKVTKTESYHIENPFKPLLPSIWSAIFSVIASLLCLVCSRGRGRLPGLQGPPPALDQCPVAQQMT